MTEYLHYGPTTGLLHLEDTYKHRINFILSFLSFTGYGKSSMTRYKSELLIDQGSDPKREIRKGIKSALTSGGKWLSWYVIRLRTQLRKQHGSLKKL